MEAFYCDICKYNSSRKSDFKKHQNNGITPKKNNFIKHTHVTNATTQQNLKKTMIIIC